MYKYAIINDSLRLLDLSTEKMNPVTVTDPSRMRQDSTYPYIVDVNKDAAYGTIYVINMNIDRSAYPTNATNVTQLKDSIIEEGYTSIQKVYPRMRMRISYKITDKNGAIVESGSKVRICNIGSLLRILPISTDNSQEYSDVTLCNDVIDVSINVTTLGISKNFTAGEYDLHIEDIAFSVAMCDQNVSDSYMTKMQQEIGWSDNSITQEELGEYYYTIFTGSIDDERWSPIVIHDIKKFTRCSIHVSTEHDIFANIANCKEIEDIVFMNQRKALKYEITATVDGTEITPVKDIIYNAHAIIETTATAKPTSIKITSAYLKDVDTFTINDTDYDDDGNLHTTNGNYTYTIAPTSGGSFSVSVYIDNVVDNLSVEISTETSATE